MNEVVDHDGPDAILEKRVEDVLLFRLRPDSEPTYTHPDFAFTTIVTWEVIPRFTRAVTHVEKVDLRAMVRQAAISVPLMHRKGEARSQFAAKWTEDQAMGWRQIGYVLVTGERLAHHEIDLPEPADQNFIDSFVTSELGMLERYVNGDVYIMDVYRLEGGEAVGDPVATMQDINSDEITRGAYDWNILDMMALEALKKVSPEWCSGIDRDSIMRTRWEEPEGTNADSTSTPGI